MDVGSVFPESVDVEYRGEQITVGVKYPWKPVKCLECHMFGHTASYCGCKPKGTKQQKSVWVKQSGEGTSGEDSGAVPEAIVEDVGPSSVAEGVDGVLVPHLQVDLPVANEKAAANDLVITPVASPVARPNAVGIGRSPVLKGSNSFSALALVADEVVEVGVEEGELILSQSPNTLDPVIIAPPGKKGKGRAKAKGGPPAGKKGGGGGSKA